MATVRVGVSGWRYPSWRGDFYPETLPQRLQLSYLAERTTSAELNGSFYSLQRPSTYQAIHEQTPDDFVVAVKGGRFITHMKRLRGIEAPLANFFASGVLGLKAKLGPLLWQLPPQLKYDEELISSFLTLLPRTTTAAVALAAQHDDKVSADRTLVETDADRPLRHALEVRHESFCAPEAIALLRAQNVAFVVADSPRSWPVYEEPTSDHMYVRLHGHSELYASGYSPASLDAWAAKALAWRNKGLDVYVYFDNDMRGRAPHDAVALLERVS